MTVDNLNEGLTIPTWFKVVSIIMLLWNLMGLTAFGYDMMMTDEMMAALPEAQQKAYAEYPAWTKIFYALAVFGGVIGCIGLLMRKKWAKMALLISFVGVIVQQGHSLFLTDAVELMGTGAAVMGGLVIAFSAFLLWLVNHADKEAWLS